MCQRFYYYINCHDHIIESQNNKSSSAESTTKKHSQVPHLQVFEIPPGVVITGIFHYIVSLKLRNQICLAP